MRELERLVASGVLRAEPVIEQEFEGLLRSGSERLQDARHESNSVSSRFDLAYNAAHAFALAALRWHGFRPVNRYVVFQALPHTLGTATSTWRLLAKCHDTRNRTEYEGAAAVDETLLKNLIEAAEELRVAIAKLVASR